MIPIFEPNGILTSGIHNATWREFVERFGFSDRRKQQLAGLFEALANLKDAGCTDVYINGSFVTSKNSPGDFDACWDSDGVDLTKVDPVLLDFSNDRMAQKQKYLGELFPNIKEGSTQLFFLDFFQRDKADNAKGIIRVDLRTLP
jgi:hypothetical protein